MAHNRLFERRVRRPATMSRHASCGQRMWQISPGHYISMKAAIQLAEEIEANKDKPLLIEWKAPKADLDTLDKLLGHEAR